MKGTQGGRPHKYRVIDGQPQRLTQIRVPFDTADTNKAIALLLDSGDPELLELLKQKGII